jgi:hypothetical protein
MFHHQSSAVLPHICRCNSTSPCSRMCEFFRPCRRNDKPPFQKGTHSNTWSDARRIVLGTGGVDRLVLEDAVVGALSAMLGRFPSHCRGLAPPLNAAARSVAESDELSRDSCESCAIGKGGSTGASLGAWSTVSVGARYPILMTYWSSASAEALMEAVVSRDSLRGISYARAQRTGRRAPLDRREDLHRGGEQAAGVDADDALRGSLCGDFPGISYTALSGASCRGVPRISYRAVSVASAASFGFSVR